MRRKRPLAERFWSGVKIGKPDACWPWMRQRNPQGYGKLKVDGFHVRAHRIAYQLARRRRLSSKLHVLHSCDNPPCCNPAHLFRGTDLDNMRDCMAKRRRASTRGENNGDAKLTERQVRVILGASRAIGVAPRLAARFGVSVAAIYAVRDRKLWRHVAA